MLILDTHVWLWAATGNGRGLGRRARRLIERAEADGTIRVSVLSVFELVALHTRGRLHLEGSPDEWVRKALDTTVVRLAEVTTKAAIDAGQIPREALGDPLDRLLVATARQSDATLLTADERILHYAARHDDLETQDARL